MIDTLYTCYWRAINQAVNTGDRRWLLRARTLRKAMWRRMRVNMHRERGLHD
jgi:hypothetical protein